MVQLGTCKELIAAISNSITVAVLGTILLHTYAKTKIKTGSLDRED